MANELFRTSQVGTEIYTRLTNLETANAIPLPSPIGHGGQVLAATALGTGVEWRSVTGTGTVSSVAASGGSTGLTLTGGPITAAGTLTLGGTLVPANGGTGFTSYTNGQLLIGNSTGNTLAKATLTQGTGITITNGAGTITIAAALTSVNASGGTTGLSFTGGPITSSGTLTLGGTLIAANGGTGLSSITSGQVLYGGSSAAAQSAGLRFTTNAVQDNLIVGVGGTASSAANLTLNAGSGTLGGASISLTKNTSGSNILIGHGSALGFTGSDDLAASLVSGSSFVLYVGLSSIFSVSSSVVVGRTFRPSVYTVATLPSAAAVGTGTKAHVSDANATTFNSAVAGGGANSVPVFVDGANTWRIG